MNRQGALKQEGIRAPTAERRIAPVLAGAFFSKAERAASCQFCNSGWRDQPVRQVESELASPARLCICKLVSCSSNLLGLFGISFLAATLLPAFKSELGLSGLDLSGKRSNCRSARDATASLGNTLGSVVNWGLGRGAIRFADAKPGFPVKADKIEKSYGVVPADTVRWSLLMSWGAASSAIRIDTGCRSS